MIYIRRIYIDESINIAKVVKDHLNKWEDKPCDILFEDFKTEPTSMMMQQMSGSVEQKRYVNGSYNASFPFAVYIRVSGEDTANRLDATGCLRGLAEWLKNAELPVIDDKRKALKFEMTSIPSISVRYEDGIEDYQALYKFDYYVRRA